MLVNDSAWFAEIAPSWDKDSQPCYVVVVKQNFEYSNQGEVSVEPSGPDITMGDGYQGEGALCELIAANDMVPFKQGFEWYGHLTCFPPTDRAAHVMEVSVELINEHGVLMNKTLRVTGERRWRWSLFGAVAKDLQPLKPTLLSYALAFGGQVPNKPQIMDRANPIGRGFKLRNRDGIGLLLPQVEYADQVLRKPRDTTPVASFAPIPHFWSPRLELQPELDVQAVVAGDYPYSEDLCAHFHNYAPADQCLPCTLKPHTTIALSGLTKGQPYGQKVTFELPYIKPELVMMRGAMQTSLNMVCDSLILDTHTQQFSLLWRTTVKQDGIHPMDTLIVMPEQAPLPETESSV
ncbi:DUF2169 domain-containing protein [Pseudoalteromonas luteoviolacea]|uniref:DUF2169 domain-containing protein n=1 Tax=Pseudoalteromonas luteoviolacea S4054 TaxID=1129367 RepID=A0A0F6A7Q6_9GAMM|nr:DUF2169 domain-containing protein [Pseudoalteromonas luteoviolacea]AOT10938.1 hypothetical protein S4054249_24170 [Pseudoalteromonas luteoviolacea]AOT15898.1 hypothetical protein S40542_24340 [Pseudoalteromonas luteoviolacea]AOT20759.1 hypothetical protein S4054_24090 [Pseudoalteromonas luteoviolacea]KKE81866.1 hypothetical protein N479_02580 [Pseudoalteromonas luteoviolacea S4054]KZN66176.1 hypothetical protein N481_24500 [Pseudoalteromonas luteoviolacea S4047-1]